MQSTFKNKLNVLEKNYLRKGDVLADISLLVDVSVM